jgi:hypothetical protein
MLHKRADPGLRITRAGTSVDRDGIPNLAPRIPGGKESDYSLLGTRFRLAVARWDP